jgi:hypothetical protein
MFSQLKIHLYENIACVTKTTFTWQMRFIHIYIINFMGHDLEIIVVWNLFFIGLYGLNIDVIHLFVLFKPWCHAHCLNMNVMCLFIWFRHICWCLFVLFTQKNHAYEFHVQIMHDITTYEIIDFAWIWNKPMKPIKLWCMDVHPWNIVHC